MLNRNQTEVEVDRLNGLYTYRCGDKSLTMPIVYPRIFKNRGIIDECPRCGERHTVSLLEGTVLVSCGELYARIGSGPYLPWGRYENRSE